MNSDQLARFVRKTNNRLKLWPAMIVVLVVAVVIVIAYPVLNKAKQNGVRMPFSDLKQLALGNLMYASDNDDRLPLASRWMDDLQPYTKNKLILIDPLLEERKEGDESGQGEGHRPLSNCAVCPEPRGSWPQLIEKQRNQPNRKVDAYGGKE